MINTVAWSVNALIMSYVVCVCETGMSELDYGLYPSRELQLDWLHTYLKAYKSFTKKGEEVSQRELETLYVQVNKFSLVSKSVLRVTGQRKSEKGRGLKLVVLAGDVCGFVFV